MGQELHFVGNRRLIGGGHMPSYVPKTLVPGLVARFGLRSSGKVGIPKTAKLFHMKHLTELGENNA